MKLILRKTLFLFVCLICGMKSFSQDPKFIKVIGKDSISVQVTTDTPNKKVYTFRVNLKNDSVAWDTFKLAKPRSFDLLEPNKFKLAIRKYFKNDTIAKVVADTIKKLMLTNKDFKIEVSLPGKAVVDTTKLGGVGGAGVPGGSSGAGGGDDDKSWWQVLMDTTPLLLIVVLLVMVIVCLVLLLFDKRSKQRPNKPDLPESLLKIFPEIKKKEDIEETVRRIRNTFYDLRDELQDQKRKNKEANTRINELEESRETVKKELLQANQTIRDKEQELLDAASGNEAFNERTELILDKYFRDLSMTLEQNKIKDNEEIYRLILTRLITFSMHSASILKKQIRDATELDSLNLQLLSGEHPRPKDIITENTQFGHVDPLAYHIYHLLKKHEVEGLPDVFIKGYKIGN